MNIPLYLYVFGCGVVDWCKVTDLNAGLSLKAFPSGICMCLHRAFPEFYAFPNTPKLCIKID